MKRFVPMVATLLAMSTPALAAPPGFAFLEVPAGARGAAMGGAYASLARGAEAVFWNPAGLADVQGSQVVGAHAEYFENLRHDQFALAGRLFGGGLAASLRAMYSEPIDERDDLGNLIGTFGTHDLEFGLGYGWRPREGLAFGLTGNLMRERIANLAVTTWGVDAGAMWEPSALPRLRLAAGIDDVGPSTRYLIDGVEGRPVSLPSALHTGASWRFDGPSGWQTTLALDSRAIRGRSGIVAGGLELATPLGAAVRAGLRGGDAATDFSMGAGWKRSNFSIDYAFVPSKLDLADTHRFAFGAQF